MKNLNSFTGTQVSVIESLGRLITMKNKFFKDLNTLVEHYNIKDNVFGFVNGDTREVEEGYYGEIKEANTLLDLYEDFNILENCIRIKDGKFYLGKWYNTMSDIKESVIIDLKNSVIL